MDLRIQKTRQNIFQAFIELREKYPLEKITVKELTERAQISKQTFYLHYRDMYDLSERIEQSMIQETEKGYLPLRRSCHRLHRTHRDG